jgi:X-Pro dipeptidyl-peptidase
MKPTGRTSRRTFFALALVVCLTGGVLFAAPAPADPPYQMSEPKEFIVKTPLGGIFVEAILPLKDGKPVTAPTILTYSPYSVLGRNGDANVWVPRGYARLYADVVGTGNSGGCWDYGGNAEKKTGYKVVEWIADQKWSNGKVAMTGGSYNGTTAIATATTKPPHLVTIVPEAAIGRWYDYAFSGGIRYAWTNEAIGHQGPDSVADEGLDTPLAFDFGFAIPPPTDVQNEGWADRVASTITPCDEVAHTEHGYDQTPDYDKFWRERDYVKDLDKVKIPVLVAHNWGDWNVKQVEAWDVFHALKNSRKRVLFTGTRWVGHGVPGGDYQKAKTAWMDHYLLGNDTGANKFPSVVSQTSDSEGPGKWFEGMPHTTDVSLFAQFVPVRPGSGQYQWQLLPRRPEPPGIALADTTASFPSTNINTESHANHHMRQNHDWQWFESPPLKQDTRIFGEIKVQVYLSTSREWVTMTPTVVDVDLDDHLVVSGQHVGSTDPSSLISVTRGWLDSRYRSGLAKQVPMKNGKVTMTVVEKPQDYTFKAGHIIGLSIQTEILEWSLPKPYPCDSEACVNVQVNWQEGKSRLIIPVVGHVHDAADLFGGKHEH